MTAPVWEGTPRQRLAMGCPADEVMFGGRKGGGKSDALIMRPLRLLRLAHDKYLMTGKRQRCRCVIFRKTLTEQRDLIDRASVMYPQFNIGGEYSAMSKAWCFDSGATVEFGHFDGPEDHRRWNGVEIVGLGIDQVEEMPFNVYKFLVGQVRTPDPDFKREQFVFVTANPGGLHAEWVYEYFVKPNPEGEELIKDKITLSDGRVKYHSRCFIPAALQDNPYLANDGEYEKNLRTMTEEQQRWYLHGEWGVSADSFFGALMSESAIVDSRPIKGNISIGLAWFPSPAESGAVLIEEDEETGELTVIDEICRKFEHIGALADAVLGLIAAHDLERPWCHVIGTVRFSDMVCLYESGLKVNKRDRDDDRSGGWSQVLQRLGSDGIKVFGDKCPRLAKQLKKAVVDPKHPGDIVRGESPALEALRVACYERPIKRVYERTTENYDPVRMPGIGYGD